MIAVVDVSKYAPLVVDLACVGVASDGLLHEVQDDGRLLLHDVDGASGSARIRAGRAALEGEDPPTLAEGSDVVKPPSFDGVLPDRADHCNAVGVELEVDHSIFNGERLSDLSREQESYRKEKGNIV